MRFNRLGRTGLKVSNICLGTMQFGWTTTAVEAHNVMNHAIDIGCNFFDTADIYSGWAENSYVGQSEEIIGDWLATNYVRRDAVIIATKVRGKMGNAPTDEGLSRQHIISSVHNSLRRLQTDYIDLYQVHWPDAETPLDETLGALDDLVRQGLVRYVGCSNYPAWLLTKALWVSDVRRLARFDTLQPHYSLVHRAEFERELQPLCEDQRIGVIPYSPLAGGFLTGKYRRDEPWPESARAEGIRHRYANETGYTAVEKLAEIAQAHSATIAQTAIAWVLANPVITSAIIGANTITQLEETAAGGDLILTPEEKETLDQTTTWQ
jgi:1-deoxyxylulose-5-phosphate synthase